ncbi:hypothetical protein M2444_003584 [Paenibacillus sp. PastF-3]|uniref:hypothetical protein n=1 Tax=Paenibacillus sp. PastF-3 TaxID=2940626 RepID=UPI0024764BAE|nr:hypothetical protein [Paenibacillus sp. PastF-3]MDH6371785.1 hypothetical protein [Paenibacillus sp. PastF-3]
MSEGKVSLPTPERIEEIKHYFTDEQLDEMSREYRTMPTDGEGYAIEPEYEGMVARGNIVKLISDVKTARAALEESQQRIGKLELYVKSLEFNREDTQKRVNEKLRERDTKLAEAQQTIALKDEALRDYEHNRKIYQQELRAAYMTLQAYQVDKQ